MKGWEKPCFFIWSMQAETQVDRFTGNIRKSRLYKVYHLGRWSFTLSSPLSSSSSSSSSSRIMPWEAYSKAWLHCKHRELHGSLGGDDLRWLISARKCENKHRQWHCLQGGETWYTKNWFVEVMYSELIFREMHWGFALLYCEFNTKTNV